MTPRETVGAIVALPVIFFGFIAFLFWLVFWKIPRNLVIGCDDHAN